MPILPAEPDLFPAGLWALVAEAAPTDRVWWCLHTKPRQEKATARDLRSEAIPYYLPQVRRQHRTPAGRSLRSVGPLFGGYLFLWGSLAEKRSALRGDRLVGILEVADQRGLVADLQQIHQMSSSGLLIEAEPQAAIGQRVRITSGPLAGLIGIVIRRGKRDHFVAVVAMLGLGATVVLEDWQVEVLATDSRSWGVER